VNLHLPRPRPRTRSRKRTIYNSEIHMNPSPEMTSRTLREPKPGEWIAANEFAEVIRLTPLVAIDLIVRSPEAKVLVGRRVNEPAKGLLFVPGSRISKNETRAAAFKRITREELGTQLPIDQSRFV